MAIMAGVLNRCELCEELRIILKNYEAYSVGNHKMTLSPETSKHQSGQAELTDMLQDDLFQ